MIAADKDFLDRLTQMIDSRIHDTSMSAVTLAAEFFITQRHFNRRVNAVTGMNATLYIRSRRILKACQLLKETGLPISQIYVKCGIESANYFSRIFKSEMGMTPTEYRNQYQK